MYRKACNTSILGRWGDRTKDYHSATGWEWISASIDRQRQVDAILRDPTSEIDRLFSGLWARLESLRDDIEKAMKPKDSRKKAQELLAKIMHISSEDQRNVYLERYEILNSQFSSFRHPLK